MIIVLKKGIKQEQIDHVVNRIEGLGLKVHLSRGVERTIIGVIGDEGLIRTLPLDSIPGVEKVMPVLKPYKLAGREFHPEGTIVDLGSVKIGGENIVVMAGPCSVENREQMFEAAEAVQRCGAKVLRGGAFKPRTSPHSFQGLGEEGLKLLAEVREIYGLKIVTEVMGPSYVEIIEKYTDIFQIGTRNMQNFSLLREVGKTRKPVLLKRGMSATYEEFILAAEYVMMEGNPNVILCERGIRTFETYTRNTLDICAVPVVKSLSHLPVIIDPSHGTGSWELVIPLSLAAIAAGADGLLVEVHPHPQEALSDGSQSLMPEKFELLMQKLERITVAVGRKI